MKLSSQTQLLERLAAAIEVGYEVVIEIQRYGQDLRSLAFRWKIGNYLDVDEHHNTDRMCFVS